VLASVELSEEAPGELLDSALRHTMHMCVDLGMSFLLL